MKRNALHLAKIIIMVKKMQIKPFDLVRFSDGQKQYFLNVSGDSRPEFLKNNPEFLDLTFLFLGESPNTKLQGYGYFIPISKNNAPVPNVFDCHLSCFVHALSGKHITPKADKYKEALELLSAQITVVLDAFDKHFLNDKSIPEKTSKNIAKIANALDFSNDRARLTLGLQISDKEEALKKVINILE